MADQETCPGFVSRVVGSHVCGEPLRTEAEKAAGVCRLHLSQRERDLERQEAEFAVEAARDRLGRVLGEADGSDAVEIENGRVSLSNEMVAALCERLGG